SISVPASPNSMLSFNYYLVNECGSGGGSCYYDRLSVEISSNGGTSYTEIANSDGGGLVNGGWHSFDYDLSSYAGMSILIKFVFNSIDGYGNANDGVYIDDVSVWQLCPNDAGIAQIDSPSIPACNLGNNVYATIANYGSSNLTSA